MSAVYRARGRPGLYALMTVYLQPFLRLVMIGIAILIWPTVIAVVAINTIQILFSSLAVIFHNRAVHADKRALSRIRRLTGARPEDC